MQEIEFTIADAPDVMAARRGGMALAQEIGFANSEATKIAVAISELGRNILNYAGTGSIYILAGFDAYGQGFVKIVAEDQGPGIPNIDQALADGYTTSGGMGLGLSGSKRMMDDFEIESQTGVGTRVTAVKWVT